MNKLFITECPRDAMQGIHEFIPTDLKVKYLNSLLKVGFDVIDFGSFVSPKAIPQLKDTAELMDRLDLQNSKSKLLAIVANDRGAADACRFQQVTYLGFPLSVSETFQQRNTNATIEEAFARIEDIQDICLKNSKQLVVYLSMAFGNPYGDDWNPGIVSAMAGRLNTMGISRIMLADTIGTSDPGSIKGLFTSVLRDFGHLHIGAHLHSVPGKSIEKIEAAYTAGCRNFDSAIHGFGGCPMAADELTGNIATEDVLEFSRAQGLASGIDTNALKTAFDLSWEIFNKFH
jgi:hydroxymethylglutaryl-CoA lyase